ncbi:hypothetical protein JKP88DRAFT_273626 [Tribonema minus]|uniref:Uncharacterized protein n=1 Tax=Tribonema minus TaxID=303371 RepID=A0A835YQM6_9STRA|nr:hypothetical protein JKP88DRAFT_273626 [Tribonema minus]
MSKASLPSENPGGVGDVADSLTAKDTCNAQRLEERELMMCLCSRRKLPTCYFEAALSLWIRVKSDYAEDLQKDGELVVLMITALSIAVKFMGPQSLTHYAVTMDKARDDGWKDVTSESLMTRELTMAQNLNWDFFNDRIEAHPLIGGAATPASPC